MAKAVKKTAPKTDLELNRWCIEMAMRWPTHSMGGYGGSVSAQFPRGDIEADIISRANRIKAWVKSA